MKLSRIAALCAALALGFSGQAPAHAAKVPGPCTREEPVVFVHGFLMNGDNAWVGLQDALARAGWCTYSFTYGAVAGISGLPVAGFGTTEEGARELAAVVERARRETSARQVNLVTHSKGGAVAANFVARHPGLVDRVVNIGGVAAPLPAGFPGPREDVPAPSPQVSYLNIASRWDVIVPNQSSLPRCGTCTNLLIKRPVGHVGLLYDREVSARTLAFLAAP